MSMWQRFLALFRQPGEQRIYLSPRQAGVSVTEDTALTFSAVWACVRVISETVGALPWHVYRKTDAGREQVDGGIGWLLNIQPNAEMTAVAFREALVAHALTWGNGYAEIVRDLSNRPSALVLLTPDRVEPKRDQETGALYYEVKNDDGTRRNLTPQQVFHLHGLGFDGVVGYSPIRMAARSIGLGIAQDTFGQAFYSNGTTFGGFVEVPASMNPDQIKLMEDSLNEKHGGPDKAFRVRVIAQGMKFSSPSMPMTDAQFLESRKFSVTEVARWFRVPPHKIADLDRSTNNNIEHQSIEFVTDTVMPWLARLEQEANVKLFGTRASGSVYTKFTVNALMRGDSKARAEFYRAMVSMGAMSINEVRALEELNSIEAGDEHLVQLNQTTLERLVADPPDAKPTTPEPAPAEEPDNVIRREALDFLRQRKQA